MSGRDSYVLSTISVCICITHVHRIENHTQTFFCCCCRCRTLLPFVRLAPQHRVGKSFPSSKSNWCAAWTFLSLYIAVRAESHSSPPPPLKVQTSKVCVCVVVFFVCGNLCPQGLVEVARGCINDLLMTRRGLGIFFFIYYCFILYCRWFFYFICVLYMSIGKSKFNFKLHQDKSLLKNISIIVGQEEIKLNTNTIFDGN